jgi:hypothetical protein
MLFIIDRMHVDQPMCPLPNSRSTPAITDRSLSPAFLIGLLELAAPAGSCRQLQGGRRFLRHRRQGRKPDLSSRDIFVSDERSKASIGRRHRTRAQGCASSRPLYYGVLHHPESARDRECGIWHDACCALDRENSPPTQVNIMGSIFSFGSRTTDQAMSGIDWETRYDGALSVAVIDQVPVAGISGPWPDGNYALTFWSIRELEVAPSLEFHSSIEFARRRVEEMASQIARTI